MTSTSPYPVKPSSTPHAASSTPFSTSSFSETAFTPPQNQLSLPSKLLPTGYGFGKFALILAGTLAAAIIFGIIIVHLFS